MKTLTNKKKPKQEKRLNKNGLSVAIGNFDGVHKGHQEILKKGIDIVYTFYPHPSRILHPENVTPQITSLEERLRLIKKLGISTVIVQKFTQKFSQKSAKQFFNDIIIKKLRTKTLYVGYNFFFGKNRGGNTSLLKQWCKESNIKLNIIKPFKIKNEIINSTAIRKLIQEGHVKKAALFLGRPYFMQGVVTHGKKRRLGIPTTRLKTMAELLPKAGVYATWTEYKNTRYPSVTNVGHAPTFLDHSFSIETHILNFDREIYGESLTLHFIDRLRDIQKFDSPQALKNQIQEDIQKTKILLGGSSKRSRC